MTLTGAAHVTPYMVDAKADQIWTRVDGLRREVLISARSDITFEPFTVTNMTKLCGQFRSRNLF